MLSGTWREPEVLRGLIRQTQAQTTRPFGVNLVLAWDMTERLELCLEEGVRLLRPHLVRLRNKLEKYPDLAHRIINVRGNGYMMI